MTLTGSSARPRAHAFATLADVSNEELMDLPLLRLQTTPDASEPAASLVRNLQHEWPQMPGALANAGSGLCGPRRLHATLAVDAPQVTSAKARPEPDSNRFVERNSLGRSAVQDHSNGRREERTRICALKSRRTSQRDSLARGRFRSCNDEGEAATGLGDGLPCGSSFAVSKLAMRGAVHRRKKTGSHIAMRTVPIRRV